jgi:hypothetical protein
VRQGTKRFDRLVGIRLQRDEGLLERVLTRLP